MFLNGSNGNISSRHFPEGNEIFYRLPFARLHDHQERVTDAWKKVRPAIDAATEHLGCDVDKSSIVEEISSPEDSSRRLILSSHGRSVLIAESISSDLWIKFSPESDGDAGIISLRGELDKIMISLDRPVYKHVCVVGELQAFPLEKGVWESDLKAYLGLDAGSISINLAVVDERGIVLDTLYTLTEGDLINNIKKAMARMHAALPGNIKIMGSGVTGSGHEIAMALLGADIYETELDAHAEAALHMVPGCKVVFDIGGQDSKVMYINDGSLEDAGMNKKCGAGTGAFLDAQAHRLGIPIEKFGQVSLNAQKPYRFSSMCTVFVGRDLISEQAKGNTRENIISGLHRSLAMNFFSTLGINKKSLETPIVFQGGVAGNIGVKVALEQCLEESRGEPCEIIVPMHHGVMGAVGMALIAKNEVRRATTFRGFNSIARVDSVFCECDRHREVGCGREILCDLVKLSIGDDSAQTLYACKEYYHIPALATTVPAQSDY